MNKKGQALVEFIIIIPVFMMILLGIIDFGKIIYNQNVLENKVEDVVSMYKQNFSFDKISSTIKKEDKKMEIEFSNDNDEFVTISIKKKIDILTPGLNVILGNPYIVKVNRVIEYEA